jgi:ribosomal protein S18 acetylase RimI-like enzyme
MIPPDVLALSPFAHERVQHALRRRSARRMRDRRGRVVEIGEWLPEDWNGLLEMYRSLDPAQRAQGLPPLTEERRAAWVDDLCRRGVNVVARCRGRIIGHAAAVRDGATSYELVVFVDQNHQGAGVGRALLETVIGLARGRGAERVWLMVERHNSRAIALYRRLGLRRVPNEWSEETWALPLGDQPGVPPSTAYPSPEWAR